MKQLETSIEVELRYEMLEDSRLEKCIEGLTFISRKRVIDSYLDTPAISLLKRGIYIRVRNNTTVDVKFNSACLENPDLPLQSYCEEHSFVLPLDQESQLQLNKVSQQLGLQQANVPDFEQYKQINNLIDHRTVDKMRSTYKKDIFTITHDEVVGLGNFLEIEIMAQNTHDIELITQQMRQLLKNLKLKPLTTGYDSLILRKNNFEQYLQGRFILEEDRIHLQSKNL